MSATELPPVESKYKSIGDLLTEYGQGFRDKKLDEAYKRYKDRKGREKKPAKNPMEWARRQTSSDYRKPLEADFGPDFFKEGKAKVNIRDEPRPRDYPPDRYQVKSGRTGGQEATVQFFEWVEKRLERGNVLLVPGKKPVACGPLKAQREAGIGTVSGLANAKTYIITPKGAEHLGLGSAMQTVTTHERSPLATTASEIEFVTRLLLESYITPQAAAVKGGPYRSSSGALQ